MFRNPPRFMHAMIIFVVSMTFSTSGVAYAADAAEVQTADNQLADIEVTLRSLESRITKLEGNLVLDVVRLRPKAKLVLVSRPYDGSTPKKVSTAPVAPPAMPNFKLPLATPTAAVKPVSAGTCTGPNCGQSSAGGPVAGKVRAIFHWRPLARRSRGGCRGC